MILYQLKCAADHGFEAWFRNGETFDRQAAAGTVLCPVCGDSKVSKAPMAPRIAKSVPRSEEPAPAPVPAAAQGEVIAKLRELRRMIEANAENVGERFAEEARRIHYGETEARAIYGDTTPDEADALTDEGVPFTRIPWVPRHDS